MILMCGLIVADRCADRCMSWWNSEGSEEDDRQDDWRCGKSRWWWWLMMVDDESKAVSEEDDVIDIKTGSGGLRVHTMFGLLLSTNLLFIRRRQDWRGGRSVRGWRSIRTHGTNASCQVGVGRRLTVNLVYTTHRHSLLFICSNHSHSPID